jgi:hypothetical protein
MRVHPVEVGKGARDCAFVVFGLRLGACHLKLLFTVFEKNFKQAIDLGSLGA